MQPALASQKDTIYASYLFDLLIFSFQSSGRKNYDLLIRLSTLSQTFNSVLMVELYDELWCCIKCKFNSVDAMRLI